MALCKSSFVYLSSGPGAGIGVGAQAGAETEAQETAGMLFLSFRLQQAYFCCQGEDCNRYIGRLSGWLDKIWKYL